MEYSFEINRKDFSSYREYLGEVEYRQLKKVIVEMVTRSSLNLNANSKLLDMACWDGLPTAFYGKSFGISKLFGLDFFDTQIDKARGNGVDVLKCNFETDKFPYPDNEFDVVIANQIFEHLKQIYNPLSEIHRVLKPGGLLIFSVPNLAALHCRLQLLFGKQPSTIKLFEAHVRGFSPSALAPFLKFNELFDIELYLGSGFYPFPIQISRKLSRFLPKFAVYQLYALRKKNSGVPNWTDEILRRGVQSNF